MALGYAASQQFLQQGKTVETVFPTTWMAGS